MRGDSGQWAVGSRQWGVGSGQERSAVLPKGWIYLHLKDFCNITMGQSPPGTTYNTEKIGLPFFQGKAEFGKLFPTPKKYCSLPKKTAKKGDILISVRAPVGPINVSSDYCCIGRGLAAICTYMNESQSFTYYFLLSMQDWFSNQGAGSTFKAIGKDFLYNLLIPLPPLNEQKRIVAKLDQIMPRIDKVKERLDKIPVIIKRFCQSVLTAAVTGKLTEDWREENPDVEQRNDFYFFDLPKSWTNNPLNHFTEKDRGISYGVIKLGEATKNGIGCLRTSDVKWLSINIDNTKHISKKIADNYKRTYIRGNEVLVNVRGTLGGICVISQ